MRPAARSATHSRPWRPLKARVIAGRRCAYHTGYSAVEQRSLDSILVANRGEIAIRVRRTAAQHGIKTTMVYTDPDADSQHAHSSPWSFNLGPASAYLDQDKILKIAKEQRCQAIHPGYGFLSENAEFATRCAKEGIKLIGPPPSAMLDMGDKARSKEIMNKAGVPCVPGYHGSDQSDNILVEEANKIGFPVLIKAVRGGGGKGMRIVRTNAEFPELLSSARTESRNSFGNDDVLVEKYITTPRHIEVQVFADQHGNCVALGERDCSLQRRHQKILEESPAPNLDDATRRDLWEKARNAALAVNYEGAGTVEFIFDNDSGEFFFMEMNTRLQVEHPVTEMVTGQDLVYWQILVAEGKELPLTQEQVEEQIASRGHAIEARIYAENPEKGFVPDSGKLFYVKTPVENADTRIDSGFIEGDDVSSHYDPMIAKLIVRGDDREDAVKRMAMALQEYEIVGPVTNIEFLKRICRSSDFMDGKVETGYIEKHREELFPEQKIPEETLVEAALASFFSGDSSITADRTQTLLGMTWLSTQADFEPRTFHFNVAGEEAAHASPRPAFSVELRQMLPGHFSTSLSGSNTKMEVSASYNCASRTLTTHFPHTRHTSRIIVPSSSQGHKSLSLFTPLGFFRLSPAPPPWLAKALGSSEKANSLLSPMPCKILRVDVQPGDIVKKDQTLLVIESMKMETVIRSPREGLKVKRIVHGQGEVVGSGVELVEFEDAEEIEIQAETSFTVKPGQGV